MKIGPRTTTPPPVDGEATLLSARAAELARRPAPLDDEDEAFPVATFPLGEDTYAISIEHLRAAVPLTTVTAVPHAPPHVIGIVRFRGQAVTAVSFAAIFGVAGWRVDPAVLLVIEGPGRRLIAIDCEQIPRPGTLPLDAIMMARSAMPGPVLELALPGLGRVMLLDDLEPLFGAVGRRDDDH